MVGETHTGRVGTSHGGCSTQCGLHCGLPIDRGYYARPNILPPRGRGPRIKDLQISSESERCPVRSSDPCACTCDADRGWDTTWLSSSILFVTLPSALIDLSVVRCDGGEGGSASRRVCDCLVWGFGGGLRGICVCVCGEGGGGGLLGRLHLSLCVCRRGAHSDVDWCVSVPLRSSGPMVVPPPDRSSGIPDVTRSVPQ